MKAPNLTDISKKPTLLSDSNTAIAVPQPKTVIESPATKVSDTETFSEVALREAIAAQKRADKKVRRTFTISQADADYIEALSLHLGQAKGKNVSVSETVRIIIGKDRKGG